DRTLEHGEERPERLDREPRLVEVAVVLAETPVAERADRVERLDEKVADLELAQLLLEPAQRLLLAATALLSQRARPAARRRSARASRPPRSAAADARPRSARAPRGTV